MGIERKPVSGDGESGGFGSGGGSAYQRDKGHSSCCYVWSFMAGPHFGPCAVMATLRAKLNMPMMIIWPYLSECAPVPIARHTDGDLGLRLARRCWASARYGARCHGARGDRRGAAAVVVGRGCVAAGAARCRGNALSSAGPVLKLAEAVVAYAGESAAWVVVSALIKRGLLGRMRVAEDVAAAAAVVAADEVVEILLARRVVADLGFRIGLRGIISLLGLLFGVCPRWGSVGIRGNATSGTETLLYSVGTRLATLFPRASRACAFVLVCVASAQICGAIR